MPFIRVFLLIHLVICFSLHAESSAGGSGGPFLQYHTSALSNFDSGLQGNPIVIGGTGFGWLSKQFRLGGGGAGGFVWNGSDNLVFGIGYGGIVGEYVVTPWFHARMMIGGGGYAVGKILTQTDTTTTTQKISSGGFLLFHPSLLFHAKLASWVFMGGTIGYFLPNVGKLHSLTVGVNVSFGGR